jgi:ABC-type nickel/cobalt efflux system permease component RcnA
VAVGSSTALSSGTMQRQWPSSPLVGEDRGGGEQQRQSHTPTLTLPHRGEGDSALGEVRPRIEPVRLEVNRQRTPRSSFTELVTAPQLGLGIVLVAMAVSVGLGAFHALEPGHGKTVVAAYLVGSRGTAWHALMLGLIVTVTHTAGVYVLGAVTLFASHYVVPERLYPWLGVTSGLIITALGLSLFLRRYAGSDYPQSHTRAHGHSHTHDHHHDHAHAHAVEHPHTHDHHTHHHHHPPPTVSLRELLALGVTGGIVPCPAALVVLLSALSLNRVGFGLLLIVAFSIGLAAVLIAIGILMVYAHRLMARFQGDGVLITRWLPLTSAAAMTGFGMAIALQALVSANILRIEL